MEGSKAFAPGRTLGAIGSKTEHRCLHSRLNANDYFVRMLVLTVSSPRTCAYAAVGQGMHHSPRPFAEQELTTKRTVLCERLQEWKHCQ